MERKFMRTLLEWKDSPNKVALMVRGPRQVGKTYVVDEFGRERYAHYLKLDFRENPDYAGMFAGIDAESVVNRILARFPWFRAERGRSLLFLDEVQECPDAVMAIKPLVNDGRLDVVASGSLLGIHYRSPRSYPVGYVREEPMRPMDFEEYLWAIGMTHEQTESIRAHVKEKRPFDAQVLTALNRHYTQYLVVGGMPLAVRTSLEGDVARVSEVLQGIIDSNLRDIDSYADPGIRLKVASAYRLIPTELGREGKRFRFTDIEGRGNVGLREYAEPVDWLEGSGIVTLCPRLRAVAHPLKGFASSSQFKMYAMDTGLLVQMFGAETRYAVMSDDISVNEGAIAENSVLQMLNACGMDGYYYEKAGEIEIDFVTLFGPRIACIEVKSGRKRRSRSLSKLISSDHGRNADRFIKFERGNIMTDGLGVEHYPLFCAAFADSMHEETAPRLEAADPEMEI